MTDDPRMAEAVDAMLDAYFGRSDNYNWRHWRDAPSQRLSMVKALQAALAVLERPEAPSFKQSPAPINPPDPPCPIWSPEMAELLQLMAWRLANADMGWNTLNRANFWKKFKAAFHDPAREG